MNHTITRHQGTLAITIPIRTVSEMNTREHWAKRRTRKVSQQAAVIACCRLALRGVALPCEVTFVRIRPPRGKVMDPDNYASSWKHTQDAVAKLLGVDDGDAARVSWIYGAQERGTDYAVRIEVRQRRRWRREQSTT